MIKKPTLSGIVVFALLFVIAAGFLVPFAWTLLTSLKTNKEIYSNSVVLLPTTITLEHYVKVVLQMQEFLQFSYNTLSVTFWTRERHGSLKRYDGLRLLQARLLGETVLPHLHPPSCSPSPTPST